ncbi:MAG: enoyl-CoA hydratase-related protein [Chloroflexota bacterium]
MPYETVILEKRKNIAYLTLNRPEVLNAINSQLMADFREVLGEVESDADMRVLIITGAGKAFQAGADIGDLARMTPLELHQWNHRVLEGWRQLEALGKPVIAAINGFALGGGLELALACDIRVAAENAKLGLPEVSLGIIPGTGGTQRLPRLIGKGQAMEMLLTGEAIGAEEAYRIGLVNKVVAKGQAVAAAEEIALKIIKNGPLAVKMVKDAVEVGEELPLDAAIEYGHKNLLLCFSGEDAREGLKAFLEKRPPKWQGK